MDDFQSVGLINFRSGHKMISVYIVLYPAAKEQLNNSFLFAVTEEKENNKNWDEIKAFLLSF